MEEIFPKQPFVKRLEFVGSLQQGDISADGLHIVLQYPQIKDGDISGAILGTTDTFKVLSKVYNISGSTLRMHSEEIQDWDTRISSESVVRGTIRNNQFYGSEMSYKVADLRFLDLTIEVKLQQTDFNERHLSFFLSGPRTLWTVYEIGEKSFTGEEKVEAKNSLIELNEKFPFEIEVRPWYFYDETPPPESFRLKTKVLVLNFKTLSPISALSNQEFIKSATAVAEDLILLVSFLSRRWVSWYRYELHTSELLLTHVRHARKCSSHEIELDESVVPFHQAREFLKVAFTNLRRLRDTHIDLKMPLVYCVSGTEATYMEEQFSIFFLALERIKDLFAIENGLQKNLSNNDFKHLHAKLSDVIQQIVRNPTAENVHRKLPELNRPSLRTVLDTAFTKYKVTWSDLYPPGSDFTLIRTRDNLFHSSADIDYDRLFKELHRLQALVERLLLSMLGWSNFRNAPIEHERQWLSSHS